MEKFILRINELMRASNVHSVRELSAVCHIQEGTLARQLRGERAISLETIMSILKNMTNVSSEWLLRGEGPMFRDCSASVESDDNSRVPEKDVLLVPAGARGGTLDHFEREVGLNPYNAEVIPSPFIHADVAMMIRSDSMAPDYPAGTYLFLKRLVTSVLEWGQCYVLDTQDGSKFYCLRKSKQGDDYITCVPLNPSPRYEPFDIQKGAITALYKVVGAMKW